MRWLLSVLSFIIIVSWSDSTHAQNPIVYYELIKGDSVALYFNKDFMFTEKECYDYVRYIRVTNNGDFNGYFEDRSVDGKILGRGVYSHGLKHGYFETFYSHGAIFSRGYFENNSPVGNWEFYYPSGILERILSVTDSTVLMVRHIDPLGNVEVDKGNGDFRGRVAGSRDFKNEPLLQYANGVLADGKVVDGKPHGRWIVPDHNNQAYYMEKFNHGKIIKSTLASRRKTKNSKPRTMLNTFLLNTYLTELESYDRESCSESQQYFFNRYPNDFRAFSFDFRQKMDFKIGTDLRSERKAYYEYGENFMTVQFSVNEKGKPYDILLQSEWGEEFMKIVTNSLNKTVFSTNSKTMYFHMKLSFAGGYRYKYNFRFSKRPR